MSTATFGSGLNAFASNMLNQSSEPALGDWFVLHTRSRQEKAVVREGRARGLYCYLPLQPAIRRGRLMPDVRVPVLPGYVFVRGCRDIIFDIDRAGRLANILRVTDQKALEADLVNLDMALHAGGRVGMARMPRRGDWVEVIQGPFRGVRGVVENDVQPTRLLLLVRTLGTAVSLEVDVWNVEPADPPDQTL